LISSELEVSSEEVEAAIEKVQENGQGLTLSNILMEL